VYARESALELEVNVIKWKEYTDDQISFDLMPSLVCVNIMVLPHFECSN
jgi:hypothetical protein